MKIRREMDGTRIVVMATLLAAACGRAGEMTVAENGCSPYVIAVSDERSDAEMVNEAATALRDFLKESTGCALPLVRESEVSGRPAFYLGKTRKGADAGVPYARLKDYVNCRKVVGRDIFLAGNDESVGVSGPLGHHDREYLGILEGLNTHVKDLSYRRLHGTLKAVLGYLESENVVQFLLPGENGRNVLAHRTLKVRDDLDWTGSNAFPFSNGRCYGGLYTTIALGHTDIPFYRHWGGHTIPVAVPRGMFEKTHPEYFILKDGVRRPDYGPANGGHHCVSNPDVQELVVQLLKRQYEAGYKWIQLGPTDGQVPCECEQCRKLHVDPMERQWLCCRAICEKAERVIPEAKIVILSYGLTRNAPRSFDRLPSNVIVEMCIWLDDFAERFRNWERFRDVPKLAYVYFFGDYHSTAFGPTMAPPYFAKCLRILKENNAMGVYKCGFADDLGLDGPAVYAFSRLLEDPRRDGMALTDEFCERAYGPSAEPMKRFFRGMYVGMDMPDGRPVIYALRSAPQSPERMFEAEFRPTTVNYLGRLLQQAETAARNADPKVRARLALVRRSYDFLALRSKCYALADAWEATHAPSLLALANDVFDARERMLDSWYDADGRMRRLEGFDWTYMHNASRHAIVCGGGQVCPSFPTLFRYGKGSVRDLLNTNGVSVLRREYWEGYAEFGRRILLGDGLTDLQEAVKANPKTDGDMPCVLRALLSFREKNRDFLAEGTFVGLLEPLEPADRVFGVFRRNERGELALLVCATSPARQTIRFRFPGSDRIESRELGLCTLQLFKQC